MNRATIAIPGSKAHFPYQKPGGGYTTVLSDGIYGIVQALTYPRVALPSQKQSLARFLDGASGTTSIVLDVYAHGCFRATVTEPYLRGRPVSEYTLGYHGVRGTCPSEAARCHCGSPADAELSELNGESICRDCVESETHDASNWESDDDEFRGIGFDGYEAEE